MEPAAQPPGEDGHHINRILEEVPGIQFEIVQRRTGAANTQPSSREQTSLGQFERTDEPRMPTLPSVTWASVARLSPGEMCGGGNLPRSNEAEAMGYLKVASLGRVKVSVLLRWTELRLPPPHPSLKESPLKQPIASNESLNRVQVSSSAPPFVLRSRSLGLLCLSF